MTQQYTRREVGRILGVEPSRLRYWERLKLVRPRARWGERFYSFGDLVALRTVKRLTESRIPAQRVRRVVRLIEEQLGELNLPLEKIRFVEQGRDLLVIPPGAERPFSPLRQQWALPFDANKRGDNVRALKCRSAAELFQTALEFEIQPDLLPLAIDYYRQVVSLAPDWVEAHINLGVALHQLGRMEEARAAFDAAVRHDPFNGISRYDLGCVLEELGDTDQSIEQLQIAARLMPGHADARFNLALAYEKRGEPRRARQQWRQYLRHAPNGPWANQARARLANLARRKLPAPIPFPARS